MCDCLLVSTSSKKGLEPPKRVRRLERDGKMLNVNEGRYNHASFQSYGR